jgi:hypothetical protein
MFFSKAYCRTEDAGRKWMDAIVKQFHEWEALDRPWASGSALAAYIEAGGDVLAAADGERQEMLDGLVRSFIAATPWRTGRIEGWPLNWPYQPPPTTRAAAKRRS